MTSGGTALCADADKVAASSMTAADNIRMMILPVAGGRHCLRPASSFGYRERDWTARRKPVAAAISRRAQPVKIIFFATPVSAMCPVHLNGVTRVAFLCICHTIVRRLHSTRQKTFFA
jgi:hypothetical protein